MRINGGKLELLHNYYITTRENVGIKPDGQEHPNVRYHVDVSTNANDSPNTSLLEDAHGLPIDLAKPTCGVRQTINFLTTTQDVSSLVNLYNVLVLVNLFSLPCLPIRKRRKKRTL
jgi:hypothetical protein